MTYPERSSSRCVPSIEVSVSPSLTVFPVCKTSHLWFLKSFPLLLNWLLAVLYEPNEGGLHRSKSLHCLKLFVHDSIYPITSTINLSSHEMGNIPLHAWQCYGLHTGSLGYKHVTCISKWRSENNISTKLYATLVAWAKNHASNFSGRGVFPCFYSGCGKWETLEVFILSKDQRLSSQ